MLKLAKEITIGCDPEFFIKDKELDKFVPAYLTGITGTKEKPQKLKNGGAVQVDGMALEFNIKPANNAIDFHDNIHNTIKEIRQLVNRKYQFVFKPFVRFDKEIFDSTPEEYKELGCDPDFNEKGEAKTPPNGSNLRPVRAAGGHIHIGFCQNMDVNDPRYQEDCRIIANIINQKLGFNFYGRDNQLRRDIYGRGVSYRPKPYGIEIRTPSNNWVGWNKDNKTILFTEIQNLMSSILKNNGEYYCRNPDLIYWNRRYLLRRDNYWYYRLTEPLKDKMIGVNF